MVEQQIHVEPGAAAVQPSRGSPLARPDFRLLVAGQMISTAGDMFFLVAVPFLIFSTGGTATTLTATLTTFGLTRLATALPAGALADRFGPRPVMLAADALRTVAVLALAVAAATGRPTLAVLVAVAAALGVGEGCYRPATRALTPLLVPDEELPAANSINISANLLATVVGPALGGLGVALASPALVLAVDAASFVCSVATLLLIRGGRGRLDPDDGGGAANEPRTVSAFFRASAFFRVVVLMNAVIGLSIAGALQVALPVLARQSTGLGVTGYGYLMTALGVGMVAGGLSGGRLAGHRWQGRLVIVLLAVNAALLAALPGVPGTAGKLAVMALLGASDGALSVIVVTVLQRMPPPRLRGRVLGVLAFVNFVMYPLSVAGAGGVLARLDPAAVFRATGIGIALVAVIGAMSRSVRDA